MATLGSLVVSLEANMARFESDLGKAANVAEQAMARISKVSDAAAVAAKGAVAALAAGFTINAFKSGIEGAIDAAAELDHLSQKTGATVEALSGLKSVAKLSGTGLEEVGKGLQKLSKAMYEAAAGNQQVQAQFQALGLSATDSSGKLRDSGDMMLAIALKLDKMDSATQRVAVAQKLFGKAGADLLPMLHDLAEVGELNARVTADMAAEADNYEKNLVRLDARKKAFYNTIASQMLPVMNDFLDAMLKTDGVMGKLNASAAELAKENTIAEWARKGAMAVAFIIDAFDGVVRVIQIVGRALAAVAADTVSFFGAFSGLGVAFKNGGMEAVKKQVLSGFAEIKSHGEEFAKDFDEIMSKATFSSKLEAEFAKRDAGIKKLKDGIKGQISVPIVASDKRSPFEGFLDELDRMKAKVEQNEYAMLRLKAAQLAMKEGKDPSAAYAKIAELQRGDSAKAVSEFIAKLAEENQLYDEQTSILGKSAMETELLTAAMKRRHDMAQKILELQKAGKPLDEQGLAELRQKTEAQIQIEADAIQRRQELTRSWSYGANKAFQDYIDNASNAARQAEQLFTNAFKSMEDALVKFVRTGKLDFKSMADSIINDLIRIQIQNSITRPIAQAVQSSGGFGGLFSGAGDFLRGLFRADGGPVSANSPYIVGEQGPELFVPGMSGSIVPNSALKSGDSGGDSNVNISFNIRTNDSRSFQSSLAENKAMITAIVSQALNKRGRMGIA